MKVGGNGQGKISTPEELLNGNRRNLPKIELLTLTFLPLGSTTNNESGVACRRVIVFLANGQEYHQLKYLPKK